MKLGKLFTPVKSMDAQEAKKFISNHEEGTFTLLDVRQPGEYEQEHIPGAKLIPLSTLNDSTKEMDPEKPVITYCAVGGRSRVAAQMLSGGGFEEVYNLQGGIKAWQGHKAEGPQELKMDMIRGDESPAEIISLAYGMEKGLQTFYQDMGERSKDQELKELSAKLAAIEESHKKMLFDLQAEIDPPGKDIGAFEAQAESLVLEGGFSLEEFMRENASFLTTSENLLTLAMMLETQGLDLYLRFAEKSTNAPAKKVLYRIADEEKNHLSVLGRLLEKKI
jgi:rhodanese-related sulfurtransferase/rubrerythrin